MAVKVGGADGGYTQKKTFKIKDGDNVYRIFPSLGFNGKEPNGKWSKFYRIHFGYKNAEGKMRVFESPLVKNKEKMITSPDAALERIENLKAELEKAKPDPAKGKAGNKAMYDRLLPLIATQKPLYNLDSNHHMNVINENGEIGVLKLRHKGKLALDAVIKSLRSKGIEPLGVDSGRYFVINRTGTALETTYTVTVKTKSINVPGVGDVEQPIVHVMTPDIIARLEAEASDLENLYLKPTSEEVKQIVDSSELLTGKSPVIEDVLKAVASRKGGNAEIQEAEPEDTEAEETEAPAAAAPAQTAQPTVQATPAQPATQTPIAATQAAPAQTLSQPTVQVGSPTPPKAAQPVTEMSDEEFLRSLGA